MAHDDWSRMAANVLKSELAREGLDYEALIARLAEHGIEESYKGIAAKINRGTFSFSFFLQCMMALSKTELRL